jgi:hypothetical protein
MPNKVFEFFNISTLLIISVFFNINYGKDLNAPIFLMRKEEEKKKNKGVVIATPIRPKGWPIHPHLAGMRLASYPHGPWEWP